MNILKELEKIKWDKLKTAIDKDGSNIPITLLGILSHKKEEKQKAYWNLEYRIVLNGRLYESSFYIIPFLNKIIKLCDTETKIYSYDLLIKILQGSSIKNILVVYQNEELPIKEANYKLILESLDFYLDDLEFNLFPNKNLINNILNLLKLLDTEKDKIVIRLLEIKEISSFKKEIDETIKYLS